MSVTTAVAVAAVVGSIVLVVARYGADSRTGPDPTGRDAAWPAGPVRHHSPREDVRLLARLARAWAAQRRAYDLVEDRMRPWRDPATGPAAAATPAGMPADERGRGRVCRAVSGRGARSRPRRPRRAATPCARGR